MASQRQSAVLPGLITTSPPSETIRQSPVAVSDGALVWPLKDKNEERELKRESERQTWFQDESNNILDIPNGYLNVFVLLIRWHEDIDEFKGHGDEIAKLEALFRDRFYYHCDIVRLNNRKSPQNDLNVAISRHIQEHDGPDNLLIVYYTGHGTLVHEDTGTRLQLSANQNWVERRGTHIPVAFWDEAEAPLRKLAEAHVLSILDCCFASSAALKNVNEDFRVYQLLAASAVEQKTCGPGKNSFTAALITSLEELLDEHKDKSFPVTKLCEAINLKRKKTPAILWDRLQKHKRSLQLAPLQPGTVSQEEREKSFRSGDPEQASLTLRFSLKADDLSKRQIESLARHIPQACIDSGVRVRRIDWIRMETSSRRVSFRAVVKALSVPVKMRRRRSSIRRGDGPEAQGDTPSRKRSQPDESSILSSPKRRVSGNSEEPSPLTPISPGRLVTARESSSSTMEI